MLVAAANFPAMSSSGAIGQERGVSYGCGNTSDHRMARPSRADVEAEEGNATSTGLPNLPVRSPARMW
jgi:hypothetical protein